jgi:hypothetical protein
MSAASSKNDSTHGEHSLEKTNQLIDYVESLVATNEQNASTSSFLVDLIDEKFEQLENRLHQQVDELFGSLTLRLGENDPGHRDPAPNSDKTTTVTFTEPVVDKVDEEEVDEEEALNQLSAWDRRKRELLAEHGHPLEPLTSKVVKAPPVVSRLDEVAQDEEMDALHESIESINNIDPEEIEVLKEQLTSKLRDAEVELSINRAKLSQQWASLEQRQFEIAQRESMFANKYGSLDEPAKKQSLLDRLSRHLSRKTDDDDDE